MNFSNSKITLVECTEAKNTETEFDTALEAYKAATERWERLTADKKSEYKHFALTVNPIFFDGVRRTLVIADLVLKDFAINDGCQSSRVINRNGCDIGYAQAVELMDDEIREELVDRLAPCTEQEFFAAYENYHEAKLGEEWELSKENPIY